MKNRYNIQPSWHKSLRLEKDKYTVNLSEITKKLTNSKAEDIQRNIRSKP